MGNPGFPMFTLDGHAHGAHRRDENGVSLGGPPPPWPSPAGGGNRAPPRREGFGSTGSPQVGKPGFPVCSPQTVMRMAHNAGTKILYCSWEGAALPNPPAREGIGETWFPRIFTSGPIRRAHNAGMKIIIPGRAQPSQTLPAGGLFPGRASPSTTLPRAGYVYLRVRHAARIRLFVSHSLAHFPSTSQEAYPGAGETR